MPQQNENDDPTKLQKRVNAVEAIKRTPAYIITSLHSRPTKPPDPFEKMSKRKWEKSVMQWRNALRVLFDELSVRHNLC